MPRLTPDVAGLLSAGVETDLPSARQHGGESGFARWRGHASRNDKVAPDRCLEAHGVRRE